MNSTMLKLQHNIEKFPVTANQIRKHYVEFPWFVMGRMTRSTFATKENSQDVPSSIGDIVATDSVPIRTYGAKYDNVHLFIDSFSGYCTVIFGKKNDTSKELAIYTERVRLQYLKYGHILKTLQTDSLSSYQTQIFEESMLSTGIERRESSPNEHQQNGKVERYVRIMEEQVASMRAAAPWVPKRFVTLQIYYGCIFGIYNQAKMRASPGYNNSQTEDLQRGT